MTDPYRVLGVSQSDSDDDIKKAYRTLSRKYHPDANINNPNKDQAEEKFKEIQAAYNQIMDERQNGGSSFGGGSYGYNNSSSYGYDYSYDSIPNEMRAAANYINARQFAQAMNVLSSMPDSQRNGQWYFFASVASQGMGNLNDARLYISRAIALEPGNFRYRQFEQSLNWSTGWYTSTAKNYGYSNSFGGIIRWCMSMILLNLFCNIFCCGGPFRY
ncbi:MAG: J domain-containing protein [Pseudobutyrivibrio sp.]|nr:J domain-containing protein [Pseudobutyrivibrio sp.]